MASRVLVALRVAAAPERAFVAFTEEIRDWWRPNGLFQFTPRGPGRMSFEPGAHGRLVETQADGTVFEVGCVKVWDPPAELVFEWRQAGFAAGQRTEVHVHFEPAGPETRITVEHLGWDAIPQQHAARHGFPLVVFLRREAEWWQEPLASCGRVLTG